METAGQSPTTGGNHVKRDGKQRWHPIVPICGAEGHETTSITVGTQLDIPRSQEDEANTQPQMLLAGNGEKKTLNS